MPETREKEETKREEGKEKDEQKQQSQGGCLSWMRKRQREKHKPRKKNIFALRLKGC